MLVIAVVNTNKMKIKQGKFAISMNYKKTNYKNRDIKM